MLLYVDGRRAQCLKIHIDCVTKCDKHICLLIISGHFYCPVSRNAAQYTCTRRSEAIGLETKQIDYNRYSENDFKTTNLKRELKIVSLETSPESVFAFDDF